MKRGDIEEDFGKFDVSLIETFDELYALEIKKDSVYVRKILAKLIVGYILTLYMTRGLSRKTQLYINCSKKESKSCKDRAVKYLFCFLFWL